MRRNGLLKTRKTRRKSKWNNKVGRQIADYAKDHGLPKSAIDDLVMDALKNGHLKTNPKAPDPEPWEGPSENWKGSSAGRLYPDGSTDGGNSLFPWDLPGGPGDGGGGWSLPGWMKGLIGALGQAAGLISPLVLDLDGDGVELTSLSTSQAAFDLDADGFAEHTGWVKADDGLLVLDRDGNGRIDDISELFGSDTAADGFIKLAELDQNGDGLIDAGDAHFADLRVWTDQDQDGFSDGTELKSLQELNVASISLDAQAVSQTIEGNSVSAIASYTRTDGTTGAVADVWFANDQTLTLYNHASVDVPDTVLLLPYLRGYGQVADLYIAVAQDPELLRKAGEIVCSEWASLDALKAEVENLVYRWAGTQDIAAGDGRCGAGRGASWPILMPCPGGSPRPQIAGTRRRPYAPAQNPPSSSGLPSLA